MEINGKVILALPETGGTSKAGNAWKKREYVLETFDTYPRKVAFNFFGDRVDQNPLNVGDNITLSFDIESREYNGRWYTDIRGFSSRPYNAAPGVASAPAAAPAAAAAPPMPASDPFANQAAPIPQAPAYGSAGEDLPF